MKLERENCSLVSGRTKINSHLLTVTPGT